MVVAALGTAVLAPQVVGLQAPATVPRSAAALHCEREGVELCLWPELERDRGRLTAQMADFALVLEGASLPRPGTVSPIIGDGTEVVVSPRPGDPDDAVASLFGEAYVASIACLGPSGSAPSSPAAPQSEAAFMEMYRASGLISVALGGDPELAAGLSGWTPDSGSDPLGHLGVADRDGALAAFAEWMNERETLCGVANAD